LIPPEKPRGKRRSVDLREIVKWIGRNRRLSKDYEQLPQVSERQVYVAMIRLMLRRLVSASGMT
jgi:transposase